MNLFRYLTLGAIIVSAAACSREDTWIAPNPPQAGIRFVNMIPDTMALDFRIVDIPTNAGMFGAVLRSHQVYHTGVNAGTRGIRVFLSSSDPAIAQQVLFDETHNFVAGTNYTVLVTGTTATGDGQMQIITDDAPEVAGAQIAWRFIHAAPLHGAVDVYVGAPGGGNTPVFSNVTFGEARSYQTRAAGALAVHVTLAGAGTAFVNATAPAGTPGTPTVNPVAGATVGGTGMSVILSSGAVVGTAACPLSPSTGLPTCSAAVQGPGLTFVIDRRPPLTAP